MKFYINEILTSDAYSDRKIGLFTDNAWTGTGNIFDEKKTDFYRDTTLLAYGVQFNAKSDSYDARRHFDGGVYITEQTPNVSVQIVDKKCEISFDAPDEDTAIHIFSKQIF